MRDPYEVLGVDRKANAGEIKTAYRRLAKKLHPDANKNDPKAAARFAELNAAHELLGDEDKRKAFDRGEIDAEGKPRFRGFEGFGGGPRPGAGYGGFNPDANFENFNFGPEGFTRTTRRGRGGGFGGFEDILKEAFGQMGRGGRTGARSNFETEDFGVGADVHASLTVTLPEAARGVTQRLRLPTGKDVDVNIPAGITNGQQIRLKGQGMAVKPAPATSSLPSRLRRIRCSRSMVPTSGSICRSRYMRLCSAQKYVCRRSIGRSRLQFHHGLRADAHSASRAKAFPPRPVAAISSPRSGLCCRMAATVNSKR